MHHYLLCTSSAQSRSKPHDLHTTIQQQLYAPGAQAAFQWCHYVSNDPVHVALTNYFDTWAGAVSYIDVNTRCRRLNQ